MRHQAPRECCIGEVGVVEAGGVVEISREAEGAVVVREMAGRRKGAWGRAVYWKGRGAEGRLSGVSAFEGGGGRAKRECFQDGLPAAGIRSSVGTGNHQRYW